ncbi:MAG: hypothetical protein M1816_001799 [Peltula sp. TS41687]|nr:MAG: hypothetical protein M1816_001799 [Peltula sp. TS41687]
MNAADRVFNRREALAKANPFSVLVVGFGASFVYRQGILCYRSDDTFRILNVHDSGQLEKVIHLPTLINDEIAGHATHSPGAIKILNYSEDVLLCFYAVRRAIKEAYVLAIRIYAGRHGRARCLITHQTQDTERIIARNNRSFLCCGVYTCFGVDGRRGWTITCLSLSTEAKKKIDLHNLAGSEVGVTVCFDVHQDYFYAVSTQSPFDAQAHNWVSYYHCYRFSLDDPQQERLEQARIWRRNHADGPINNSWTTLRLHEDESSGSLVIVEIRREWLDGASTSQRTYYSQPMDLTDWHCRNPAEVQEPAPSMENQPKGTTVNLPDEHYPVATRLRWWDYRPPRHTHPGVDHLDHIPRFSLSSTKLQHFDPCSVTFLNLIHSLEEPQPNNANGRQPHARLRLQIGGRELRPPRKGTDDLLLRPETDERTGLEKEGSEEPWEPRSCLMWPPPELPSVAHAKRKRVDQILNSFCSPQDQPGEIVAAADERSVVYSCGPSTSASQALVLINFDPAIRFPGLERFSNRSPPPPPLPNVGSGGEGNDGPRITSGAEVMEGKTSNSSSRWIWDERARYLKIGMGMEF